MLSKFTVKMAEEIDDKASGDTVSITRVAPEPSEPVVTIPNVELIVDGFGFMPKEESLSKYKFSQAKIKKSSKMLKDSTIPPDIDKSSCASSSNIDIVRRYTWKTKNRMIVQVI